MHVPDLSGVRHDPHQRSEPGGGQALMDRPDGEQRRDRRPLGAHSVVVHDQQPRARFDRAASLIRESLARFAEPFAPGRCRVQLGALPRPGPQPCKSLRIQEERRELDERSRIRLSVEERSSGPETRRERHHAALVQRIDGRVRHLSEPLLD